jgi:mannose-6-phosphate isomerase-like protein (cupin superfamily)
MPDPGRIIDPEQLPLWHDPRKNQRMSYLINDQTCAARTLSAGLYWLAPGKQTIVDVHPDCEEAYYVVSGRGTLVLDGVEGPIEAGMTVHIPAGVDHQSINTGDVDLCYFFVYSPPPKLRDLSKIGWSAERGERPASARPGDART